MRAVNSVLLLLAGMIAGVAVVVSCGDDPPALIDAAADAPPPDPPKCDCPAAEPPLAGRIMIVGAVQTIPANDNGAQSAVCPVGTQLITGSCGAEDGGTLYDLTLQQSAFYGNPRVWGCAFVNNSATPVTIKAQAICLRLAP